MNIETTNVYTVIAKNVLNKALQLHCPICHSSPNSSFISSNQFHALLLAILPSSFTLSSKIFAKIHAKKKFIQQDEIEEASQ